MSVAITTEAVAQVLLIEDEPGVRLATAQTLELAGFAVEAHERAEQAYKRIVPSFDGVIVSDVRLPGKSGLELLALVVDSDAEIPVILITGHGDVSMAVQAMRQGAYDFVEKPFATERLVDVVRRGVEKRRLVMENRRLRQAMLARDDVPELLGQSRAIERLRQFIRTIGPADVDVLINGETGAGKEVVARQLHAMSGRSGPFVAVNCGALPETVLAFS